MTNLLQSLVEKAAFDNGWEIVENGRVFRSGRHLGALVATDLGPNYYSAHFRIFKGNGHSLYCECRTQRLVLAA